VLHCRISIANVSAAPLLCVCSFLSSQAAAEPEFFAFELSLSASEKRLLEPDNEVVAMLESWRMPGDLAMARNMPWIELRNTSLSAEISRFTLSIGDEAFRYASAMNIVAPSGSTASASVLDDGDLFELTFSDFDPGESVRFQFVIKPDDPAEFQFPDFRNVLFDAGGGDAADNALSTLVFIDPDTGAEFTLSEPLPDFAVSGPLVIAPALPLGIKMDKVDVFMFSGEFIPEPPGFILSVLGFVSLLAIALQKRSTVA